MIPSHLAAYIELETERRVEERIKLLQAEDFYTLADAVYWLNELEGPGVIRLSVLTVCITVMIVVPLWRRR